MEELINQFIADILENGKLTNTSYQNLVVTKNEDGDVQITYKNPANDESVKEIRNYLENLEYSILDEASEFLHKASPDAYKALSRIDNPDSIDKLKDAFEKFKVQVKIVVNNRIAKLQSKIDSLKKIA